jgi:hypothetical protein
MPTLTIPEGTRMLFLKAAAKEGLVTQERPHKGYTDKNGVYHAPHQQRHMVRTSAVAATKEPHHLSEDDRLRERLKKITEASMSPVYLGTGDYNVRQEKREDGFYVFYDNGYGRNNFKVFADQHSANEFSKGTKLYPRIPGIGEEIPVSDKKNKPKQFEPWTERLAGVETLDEEKIGFHKGTSTQSFYPTTTAFYNYLPMISYATHISNRITLVIVPKGEKVKYYGNDEFRVDLKSGMRMFRLKDGPIKYSKDPVNI